MAVHNSFMKQQAGPHPHSSSSASIADTHSPTRPQSPGAAAAEQTPGAAQQDSPYPPRTFWVHTPEKMALGPQIAGHPSPLLLGSSQEKETLKGNGPETETPVHSNES